MEDKDLPRAFSGPLSRSAAQRSTARSRLRNAPPAADVGHRVGVLELKADGVLAMAGSHVRGIDLCMHVSSLSYSYVQSI